MNDVRDDDLRRLLTEAVDDLEPRPGLEAVRARTRRQRRARRGWAWGVGGAVVATAATVAVVAGLAGSRPLADPDPGFTGQRTTAGEEPADPVEQVETVVWFVADTPHGPRLYPERHTVPDGDRVAPVQAALSGDASDPDYGSPWPDGTRVLSVSDAASPGTVVVDLAGPSLTDRRDGIRGAEVERAVEQLVRTVRELASPDSSVELRVEGRVVHRLFGVRIAEPFDADGGDDGEGQVQVMTPVDGSTWSGPGPLTVEGRAAAFEANVPWEIKQGDTVVKQGFATAQECCTLSPYSFAVPLPPPGTYTLVVHDDDPSGGEGGPGWQDTKTFTVR